MLRLALGLIGYSISMLSMLLLKSYTGDRACSVVADLLLAVVFAMLWYWVASGKREDRQSLRVIASAVFLFYAVAPLSGFLFGDGTSLGLTAAAMVIWCIGFLWLAVHPPYSRNLLRAREDNVSPTGIRGSQAGQSDPGSAR